MTTTATHELQGPASGPVTARVAIAQSGPLAPILEAMMGRRIASYLTMEANGLRRRVENPTATGGPPPGKR